MVARGTIVACYRAPPLRLLSRFWLRKYASGGFSESSTRCSRIFRRGGAPSSREASRTPEAQRGSGRKVIINSNNSTISMIMMFIIELLVTLASLRRSPQGDFAADSLAAHNAVRPAEAAGANLSRLARV